VTTLAPTWIDNFKPMQLAAPSGESALRSLTLTGGGIGTGSVSLAKTQEQLKAYKYWVYVAVRRIMDRAASQAPCISRVVSERNMGAAADQQRGLSHAERHYIQRWYGGYVQSVQEDLVPVPRQHPLCKLLQKVNPDDTWQSLMAQTVQQLCLAGQVYWWIIPNSIRQANTGYQTPAELWCVPKVWVEPVRDNKGTIVKYKINPYFNSALGKEVDVSEIITFLYPSPLSKEDGYSPLSAAPLWVDNTEAIEQSRNSTFKNAGRPSMLVELDPEHHNDPSIEVIDRMKSRLMSRLSGVDKHGEPIIAPPGVKLTPWGSKPDEMAFLDSSEVIRDAVLSLFGVPKTIAGITTDVNRSSVEGSYVVFSEVVINPLLRTVASTMTEKLASRFDEDMRIWFPDTTPKDQEHELAELRFDWETGALDPDERRTDRGRAPKNLPGYNTGFVAANKLPLTPQPLSEDDDPADDPEGDPEDDVADERDDETPDADGKDGKAKDADKKAKKAKKAKPKDGESAEQSYEFQGSGAH